MENKILYHLEVVQSRRDIYGNVYTSMIVTRTADGATARGTISGGAGNCESAIKQLSGGEWGRFTSTTTTLKIREYDRLVKNWPYLGCTSEQINPAVLAQMFVIK